MEIASFNVLIIGAGPGGCSTAFNLLNSGLSVAIIEKETFPREKTCGGGISESAINVLQRFPGNVFHEFEKQFAPGRISGVRFYSPDNKCLEIPQFGSLDQMNLHSGYGCQREEFDSFLLGELKKCNSVKIFEGEAVKTVTRYDKGFEVCTSDKKFNCDIIVAADGIHSVVRNSLLKVKKLDRIKGVGVTSIYKDIDGCHPNNYLEFHFVRKFLPGYFWIFPMGNNTYSVGLYMPEKKVRKKKINIKKEFRQIISSYLSISERFINASQTSQIKGSGLPWGKIIRPISAERLLLVGDAAGLVEPFTGEGIGTALLSGEMAARQIKKSFEQNAYNSLFMKRYDKEIYQQLGPQFLSGHKLLVLMKYSKVVNYLFKKALSSDALRRISVKRLREMGIQHKVTNPLFLLKILLKLR